MIEAMFGVAAPILLAVIGTSWRLSAQIRSIESKVDSVTERLDRAGLEGLRDRVTRLEARCPMCDLRGEG